MKKLESLLQVNSKENCNRVVNYVGKSTVRFKELMDLMLKGEYRVSQLAAWPMSYAVENHPELLAPYYKKIIPLLDDTSYHPAVLRSIIRALQYVNIPEDYQGLIMDRCFTFIADPQEKAAVKAFALTVLDNLSKTYPEIRQELQLVIKQRWDTETPAFRARAKIILSKK